MKYLLIDTQNMFHRSVHVSRGDANMRGALALHITLMSIAQAWRMFEADHVVLALECRTNDNWRRVFDERYKVNRQETRKALTEKEKDDQEVLFAALDDWIKFTVNRTNVTVLQCPIAEADDMLARWVQLHPDDEHVIVSSDRDFQQMIGENVIQYNGITRKVVSTPDSKLQRIAHVNLPKDFKEEIIEDPGYLLFEKIVRGDTGDNVFSAFPGARKKAKAGKPSILAAYEDRDRKGFDWNNFMMQKWTDHHDVDHLVRDCFERNRMLVDLSAHPEEVQEAMDLSILQCLMRPEKDKIGFHLMRFCAKHDLNIILDKSDAVAEILGARYTGYLKKEVEFLANESP